MLAGKSACIVITLIEWEWFEAWQDGRIKKRGHEYESIKKALGDRMWKQVVRMFPQLDGKVILMLSLSHFVMLGPCNYTRRVQRQFTTK